ncbi:unnamed protein product [Mytilus coruscus]|uniref:B box-type domain-containing protein n=1 Tax=Mytilus coruscus TaxID=42192 RepID=A0A6J8D7H0_MYTCO|nr:unnamed protein product [Mytilus coruscus]
MAQTSTSKCSLCGVNNGIYFCYECRKALCRSCRTPHDNIPASKNHTVTDLKSVDRTAFQNLSNCTVHNTNFSLYCTQCKSMICGECVITTTHRGHEFSSIDQVADQMRRKAKIQYVEMKDKLAKSSMIISKIEKKHLPEIKKQAKYTSDEIKLAIQEVHQVIDSKGDVKITEVEDFECLETDKLKVDLANRTQAHFRCSSLFSTLEQLLNEKHAISFLNAYMNLKGDLKDFQDIEFGEITDKRPPHFDKKLFMEDLIQTLTDLKKSMVSEIPKKAEAVERISEHMWRALHIHRFADVGFPHPDGENSDDKKEGDDSQQVILALLWTHQEYFDPKSLSRAQAEYHFYRLLQKQWRQTLRRVKMDDIRYSKFNMNEFRNIPRNRPLYAAICTILDQTKDENVKKAATKAAEQYQHFCILEHNMFQQKMMSTIPQSIDLEQGQYKEMVSELRSRFKKAESKALRPIDKFKMLPLFEYLKLRETISSQRNQIEYLASRLRSIASQQLADVDLGFKDLGVKNRPQKLGKRFTALFYETWSSAYESLKPKDIDDESDEGTMDILQEIVTVIYDFCQAISQDQIQRLIKEMIPPVVDPTSDIPKSEGYQASEQMRAKTEQMAREYRKLVAPATVKVMQTEIFENHIKEKLLKADQISKELVSYVEQCVDLIWYMCIQQPPMEIRWAIKGDKFDKEQFRFSGRKGKKYRMTVWPAVFLHKEGPLVAPGYAVPDK